jgi:nucleoside-diphosphate-sugar epimerase
MRVAVLGLGYVGSRLADALAARGHTLGLEGCTHLISTAPPTDEGDPVIDRVPETVTWLGYVSATSASGASPRGARRARAEHEWAALGKPLALVRSAAIYGPGRSALDRVQAGTARRVDAPGKLFNYIHVDDLVEILVAAAEREAVGVIHAADGHPLPPAATVERACELLGVDPPPLVKVDQLPDAARSFYEADNVDLDLSRLADLEIELRYPDALRGLEALYALS